MARMPVLSGTVGTEAFSNAYYAGREAQGDLEVIGISQLS